MLHCFVLLTLCPRWSVQVLWNYILLHSALDYPLSPNISFKSFTLYELYDVK